MKVEIEIKSINIIKPPLDQAGATPPSHPQKYQLSFIDQLCPSVFMQSIFFYPADNNLICSSEKSTQLKSSFSKALALFYPITGRVVDNSYIECNDEAGVMYVEARVGGCTLSDVIREEKVEAAEIHKFVPCNLVSPKDFNMAVQVNFFECGGMAIGVGISHKIADGISYFSFIKTWASISRGDINLPSPIFESVTDLFPPSSELYGLDSAALLENGDGTVVTKRFMFSASSINKLRDKYTNPESSRRPSRAEAISVFLWTRLVASAQEKDDPNSKIYVLKFPVDLRQRLDPPLPECSFGNIIWSLSLTAPSLTNDNGSTVLDKLSNAISSCNGDYVTQQSKVVLMNLMKQFQEYKKGWLALAVSSLCRFPVYDADFGWGRPAWVAPLPAATGTNLVVLVDTPSENGIEVWMKLKEEDMVQFQADKERLLFAAP